MKICPICFAEYDDSEAPEDNDFCIECYGDCVNTKLIDKQQFLKSCTKQELLLKKEQITKLPITDHSRQVLIKRIDNLINEK